MAPRTYATTIIRRACTRTEHTYIARAISHNRHSWRRCGHNRTRSRLAWSAAKKGDRRLLSDGGRKKRSAANVEICCHNYIIITHTHTHTPRTFLLLNGAASAAAGCSALGDRRPPRCDKAICPLALVRSLGYKLIDQAIGRHFGAVGRCQNVASAMCPKKRVTFDIFNCTHDLSIISPAGHYLSIGTAATAGTAAAATRKKATCFSHLFM